MISKEELEGILCRVTEQDDEYFKNKKLRIDTIDKNKSVIVTEPNHLAERIDHCMYRENYYFVGYNLSDNYVVFQYRLEEIEFADITFDLDLNKEEKIIKVEDIEYIIPYDKIVFMAMFKDRNKHSVEKINLMKGKDLD